MTTPTSMGNHGGTVTSCSPYAYPGFAEICILLRTWSTVAPGTYELACLIKKKKISPRPGTAGQREPHLLLVFPLRGSKWRLQGSSRLHGCCGKRPKPNPAGGLLWECHSMTLICSLYMCLLRRFCL